MVLLVQFYFVRDQMLMRHFVMLKMFLSASATSMLLLTFLPLVSNTAREVILSRSTIVTSGIASARGVAAMLMGASFIGIGMAVCGSCPGTVFAQLGAGSVQARWILFGAVLGALVYPYVELLPAWGRVLNAGRWKGQTGTVARLFAVDHTRMAVAVVLMFISIVCAVEFFVPWQNDLASLGPQGFLMPPVGSKSAPVIPRAIPPWIAGIGVGLLQLPLVLGVHEHLGCASSYVTVWANIIHAFSASACERVPLFAALRQGWWQVFMMIGIFIGAFTSSHLTGVKFASDGMLSTEESILGGALLTIGARIAAGCTSGHGISGMGYLSVNSFIAVAGMFAAGIATADLCYA
jgi:uncharacterized membrane protein YedE/YeeE